MALSTFFSFSIAFMRSVITLPTAFSISFITAKCRFLNDKEALIKKADITDKKDLEAQAYDYMKKYNDIVNSFPWRISKPLRKLYRMFIR